jgi:hypothetical protein
MEEKIPTFELVEEKERKFYQLASISVGFRNGVKLSTMLVGLITSIPTIVVAFIIPPSISTWMYYIAAPCLVVWWVSKLDYEGRSFWSYMASKIRRKMRPARTLAGRKVDRRKAKNYQTTLIVN